MQPPLSLRPAPRHLPVHSDEPQPWQLRDVQRRRGRREDPLAHRGNRKGARRGRAPGGGAGRRSLSARARGHHGAALRLVSPSSPGRRVLLTTCLVGCGLLTQSHLFDLRRGGWGACQTCGCDVLEPCIWLLPPLDSLPPWAGSQSAVTTEGGVLPLHGMFAHAHRKV